MTDAAPDRTAPAAAPAGPVGALGGARLGWATLVVAGLTVLAFALRAAFVHDSLLGDELFMYDIVHHRSLADVLSSVRETEKTPPLVFLLAWASAHVGDPTVSVRAPSVFFGTGLVPLTYLLGRRTVGRPAAVVGAAIVTLDPFAIFYAVENRAYSALAFFAALSTLCLLTALEGNRRRWWAAYGLAVLAVLYTHYMGAFVVVAQAAWAFWAHRERVRELLVVHGLILLGYLPWIPSYLLQQSHSGVEARRIASLAPVSWYRFGQAVLTLPFGNPFVPLRELPGQPEIAAALAVIAVGAVAAAVRAWRGGRPVVNRSSTRALMVLLAVASPVGVGLISLRPNMSFLLPRNFSASQASLALVVGWLLVSLGRRAGAVAVAVVLAVLTIGVVDSLQRENRRSAYKDAAAYIDANARPGDPVVQVFWLSNVGALADTLAINFNRPHPLGRTLPQDNRLWQVGSGPGRRVFYVLPLFGTLKKVRHLQPRGGPGNRFALVGERRYPGTEDLLVGSYRYLGP